MDELLERLRAKERYRPNEWQLRNPDGPKAADAITELAARVKVLEAELAWYGEQARLARLIHSEGDTGRHALAEDGGKRAKSALTPNQEEG